jgi:hypothetical protein
MLAELEARTAIQEIAARYADGCDHQEWDAVAGLFTEDGVFDATNVYGTEVEGRAALAKFMAELPRAIAHHVTSLYTVFPADGQAQTRMKMLVLFPSLTASVDYQWDLERTGEGWRIARQAIDIIGKLPHRDRERSA